MRKIIRRVVVAVLIVIAIVVAIPVLGLAYGFLTTETLAPAVPIDGAPAPPAIGERIRAEIPGYQRPEESTFLTYPEWSIVYAAREYAGFLRDHRESGFPYWAYVGRFWQDYALVIRAGSDYPFNTANHVMLVVIGTSHTIEHAIQSLYENTFGWLTELLSGDRVPEDVFLADVAADYAAFLDQTPWYRFPYAQKRAELWQVGPAAGLAAARSWERKLAFGLAHTIKQAYADLIASGLEATADPAFLDIHVWAKGPVEQAIADEPNTALERDFGAEGAVFVTRRYQVFTEMIPRLIAEGISFVEIGGNDTILVTVLSEGPLGIPPGAGMLFSYALPAEPDLNRTGLIVVVSQLHTVIPALTEAGARLEHVYDY